MIEKILSRIDEISEQIRPVGWSRKIEVVETKAVREIVQEVAKEYDAFDVIYKKVCELEKRYDEDTDVGNVNGCIRLENLLQFFKEELKAPYQKSPSRCDTCANNTDADEIDNGCYMCSKGIEDNYQKGE